MPISCSCNAIPTAAFEKAIAEKAVEISAQTTLLDAVGVAYREARDTGSLAGSLMIPSCTTCFNWVGRQIQQKTHLFEGETLPAKNFEPTCPRRAMTIGPRVANSNVMEDCAGGSCVPARAVAPL